MFAPVMRCETSLKLLEKYFHLLLLLVPAAGRPTLRLYLLCLMVAGACASTNCQEVHSLRLYMLRLTVAVYMCLSA